MANNTDPPSVTSRIEEDVPFYDVSNHEGVKEPYDKWGDVLIQLTEHKKAEGEGNRWASAKSLWFAVSPGIDPTSASASIVGQNRDTVLFSIDITPSSMTATGLKEASRVILGGECEARNKALDSAILTYQRSESRKKYAYYHLGVTVNNTLFNPRGSAISETKLDVVPLRRRVRVPIGGRVMNAMEWYLVVTAVIDGTNGDNGAAEEETSCID